MSFGCPNLPLRFVCKQSVLKIWPRPHWPAYKERGEGTCCTSIQVKSRRFSRSAPNQQSVFSSDSTIMTPLVCFLLVVSLGTLPTVSVTDVTCTFGLIVHFNLNVCLFSPGWIPKCECNYRWVKNLGENGFHGQFGLLWPDFSCRGAGWAVRLHGHRERQQKLK